MKHVSGMRGWTDIGSDVSWDEYGGKWARQARDGSWYVIEFTNMWDACGEDECKGDGQCQYVAEVARVDLTDLDAETIAGALKCCGLSRDAEGYIFTDQGGQLFARDARFETLRAFYEQICRWNTQQPKLWLYASTGDAS